MALATDISYHKDIISKQDPKIKTSAKISTFNLNLKFLITIHIEQPRQANKNQQLEYKSLIR